MKKIKNLSASVLLASGLAAMALLSGCMNSPKDPDSQQSDTYYNGMELLSVAYFQQIRSCEKEPEAEGCKDLDQLRDKFAAALCAAQELSASSTQATQTPQAAQVSPADRGGNYDGAAGINHGFVIGPVIPVPPPGPSPCQCEILFGRIDLLFPATATVKRVAVVQDGKVINRSTGKSLGEGFTSFSINLKPLARQGLAEVRFETADGPISAFIAQ